MLVTKKLNLSSWLGSTLTPPLPALLVPALLLAPPPATLLEPPVALPASAPEPPELAPAVTPAEPACVEPAAPAWALAVPALGLPVLTGSLPEQPANPRLPSAASNKTE